MIYLVRGGDILSYAYLTSTHEFIAFDTKEMRDKYCSDNWNADPVSFNSHAYVEQRFLLENSGQSGMYFMRRKW